MVFWNSLVVYIDDICFFEYLKEIVESFIVGKLLVESVGRFCYVVWFVYSL